jgi:hypothetical protein
MIINAMEPGSEPCGAGGAPAPLIRKEPCRRLGLAALMKGRAPKGIRLKDRNLMAAGSSLIGRARPSFVPAPIDSPASRC